MFIRKVPSLVYQQVLGGPFHGYAPIDTAAHGGYGTYEIYTAGIDNAGNLEIKDSPEMTVTVMEDIQSAAIDWQLFH